MPKLVIYGGGGMGRDTAWLAEFCRSDGESYEVVAVVDDDDNLHGQSMNGIPIMSLDSAAAAYPDARVVAAVGDPDTRRFLVENVKSTAWAPATLVHERTEMSRFVEIGEGSVVCAGSILASNIRLGSHVQVNLSCTIEHDSILGDFATLAPGVHISGCVRLGEGVYVGTGAVFVNGTAENPIVVGEGAVVGAGACVTKSVTAYTTVVGVPARPV